MSSTNLTSSEPITTPAADVYAANTRLGRGVNLGNALEAPREGEWGVILEEEDFRLIAEAGFDSIRLPTRWSAHTAEEAPYSIDPTFFERVDWAIHQALSHGLNVVLNIHHYDELFKDPQGQEARFLAIWQQIASRYADYPDTLYFEIANEPHDISPAVWNKLQAKAIGAIRESNPTRWLIVTPVDWSSHRRLQELVLPDEDRRLIVTFHYYLPFEFTHQGAEWVSGTEKWLGRKWTANTAERQNVMFDLDWAAKWGKDNNRPIYLGEFGAYSKADMDSRALWTSFVARQAEQRGMSWAYWEFRAGFGVYDYQRKQWREPLLKALLP
ncbi:MAG: glycoside hydrolase family 5 protein [Anaerolineae bacterium]|nr:glycoside hydrolase family 5 protein [Thermoflexales bacterium]MDW8407035.1 glycoside hydrolase family 5 protein [Anaerolineae bacterium]